ncbi:hypothetical protein [Kitasatospora sp. NPDC094016]|uniref:hypothetical protein n=1 Tax=Kitasatospora sp. NPDC094016 TaxID=3154986 RepID=UPI003327C773
MSYSRGYRIEARGAWSRWTCEREDCQAAATARGEDHQEEAAWAAAAHQQQEHYEVTVREAAQALRDAARVLAASDMLLTDIDTHTTRGKACVTPQAAEQALGRWAWQLLVRLPEPAGREQRLSRQMERQFAVEQVCEHDDRPRRPVVVLDPTGATRT